MDSQQGPPRFLDRAGQASSCASRRHRLSQRALDVSERTLPARPGLDRFLLRGAAWIQVVDVVELHVESLFLGEVGVVGIVVADHAPGLDLVLVVDAAGRVEQAPLPLDDDVAHEHPAFVLGNVRVRRDDVAPFAVEQDAVDRDRHATAPTAEALQVRRADDLVCATKRHRRPLQRLGDLSIELDGGLLARHAYRLTCYTAKTSETSLAPASSQAARVLSASSRRSNSTTPS